MSGSSTKIDKLKVRERWIPFRATDLNSLMYPCFLVCAMLGVFPCKYERPSKYEFSKARFVYSSLMVLVYLILILVTSYVIFVSSANVSLPEALNANFFILLDGTSVLILYFQSKGKMRVLQDLSKASTMLSSKDLNCLAKLIHAKDIIVLLFFLSHVPNCIQPNRFVTVRHFTILYMLMVNTFTDMFYMNCVWVLKACFAKIDENLGHLKEPLTQEFLHQRQRDSTNFLLLMKLKNFEEKYMQVSDIVQRLNETSFLRIIMTAASTFTIVTFNMYFYILSRHGVIFTNSDVQFWHVIFFTPAIFSFVKFAMMIWACQTAKNRAQRIRTTLHDMLNHTTDLSIKRETIIFSLQVLHCDNRFSAKAIEMSTSLLTRIVGGIFLYLLVLFQFLLNSVLCRLKEG